MEKLRSSPYLEQLQMMLKSFSIHTHILQGYLDRYLDDKINSVRLEMKRVSDHFNEVLNQININQYIASAREGENMSEAIMEKISNIDKRLSVVENEIKHISIAISRVESDIKTLNGKIDKVLEKFDTVVTKSELKEKVDSAKWTVTLIMGIFTLITGVVLKFIP